MRVNLGLGAIDPRLSLNPEPIPSVILRTPARRCAAARVYLSSFPRAANHGPRFSLPADVEEEPMPYRSPVGDILFSLNAVADLKGMVGKGLAGDLDWDSVVSIVGEAGRFATDEIAPLNRPGDLNGARYENGVVTTAPGFGDVYRRWAEAGWNGVSAPTEFGGMGLPHAVNVACTEIWNGASMAFALCPLLTEGAVHALQGFGSRELLDRYLAQMVSGRWTGTMNLTEPQAGSDLNAIRTRAERADNGSYRLFGQKIFITYGEHDMAENIVHLVLARLPGAPAGTRGLTLFLAPKFLVNYDGSLGPRNDLRCAGIEHKLGIHASPTCVMVYGDNEGAKAWRVGEENRGLAAMFVMMNAARLAVGTQGVAIGERAYQQALAYARERRQGRGPNGGDGMAPIIAHADVQRMLMTMKANVQAARGVCHLTGVSLDLASHAETPAERQAAANRAALLTPIAKAFSSDIGDEAASLGVQVHGGMGFIEETGAAQHMRDSRIAAIYEGANGIHGIDLVQRKLPLASGETVREEIAGIRRVASDVAGRGGAGFGATAERLGEATDALEESTRLMLDWLGSDHTSALTGASPYLRLFGVTLGGACLAKAGLAAQALAEGGDKSEFGRIGLARFYAEKLAVAAPGLARAIASGGAPLEPYEAILADSA
jgi:alkylation response protein AidB-like acyl-CoA dehydrogenase